MVNANIIIDSMGGAFFLVGIAVNELAPLTIVILRLAIAALVLCCIASIVGLHLPISLRIICTNVVMGILNKVISFVLIVWGQTQIASGLASTLNATTPIFTIIIAGSLLPDEPPTIQKWLAIMLGFIGVIIVMGLPVFRGDDTLLGRLAVIAVALSYAFAGIYGRRFKALDINPIAIAAGQVTTSTLLLLPIMLFIDGPLDFFAVSKKTWLAIVTLAVLSTALAYVLYFKILEIAGATNVLLVTLLVPVSAVILGVFFLNESLELEHGIGMLFIAMALLIIDGRLLNQLWQRM